MRIKYNQRAGEVRERLKRHNLKSLQDPAQTLRGSASPTEEAPKPPPLFCPGLRRFAVLTGHHLDTTQTQVSSIFPIKGDCRICLSTED